MSIYFDFKTINELTGFNAYRQQKEYTLEELAQYNGSSGRPAYVAIEGIVYDVSNQEDWDEGMHFGIMAGRDLSDQFYSCHGIAQILKNAPKVGTLLDEDDMDDMNGMNNMNDMNNMNRYYITPMNRQVAQQDTSKFTPDDWIRYITPLVTYALREPSQGMNSQRIYQKAILMGVLVGLGRSPQEAINQVQQWQNSGESQLLKGGTGTTGTGTGTTGGMGTGGGTGIGTGTTGGMGAGGGTGIGTGTTGGMGTGGGTGTGTGTTGGMGTAGSMGTGAGTGGMGTVGGIGTGIGTTGGFGAGTGTGASGGTMGTGGGTGIGGSMGTGGGTGGNTGTGNMGSRNRLIFDE